MHAHSWVLLLSLWQLGTVPASSPTGGHHAWTPPWTGPTRESGVFWPFWVSVDVPSVESGGSTPLPLPVGLTSDPQGLPQTGSTESQRPAVSTTNTALLPEPGTGILWGQESTSTSRETAPWLREAELPTSGFTHLSPAQGEDLHLMPQPTHSLRGVDAATQTPTWLTPGIPPFTAMPNGNTAVLLSPTGALETRESALPLPPKSPDPQAGRQGPITGLPGGRSTRRGEGRREQVPKTGSKPTQAGEVKASVPDDGGKLEGVVQKPTETLTVTTKAPGCKQASHCIPAM
ncbi:hypothetical protein COCON_G00121680 [Conger conger]|uniref:Uncharacterized protein n=1 Tax=Conger conger TaxID=82655 RepID=A0A9Q1HYQ2_CONCO|nr:hypothetical protein COCON_G00121680 [Conger conger]